MDRKEVMINQKNFLDQLNYQAARHFHEELITQYKRQEIISIHNAACKYGNNIYYTRTLVSILVEQQLASWPYSHLTSNNVRNFFSLK